MRFVAVHAALVAAGLAGEACSQAVYGAPCDRNCGPYDPPDAAADVPTLVDPDAAADADTDAGTVADADASSDAGADAHADADADAD